MLSVYLHIPFCTSKCTYCAFNTYTKLEALIPDFVEALKNELSIVSEGNPYNKVHTVFFGGGTPTLLSPQQFLDILRHLRAIFSLSDDAEVTTEANPNDLSIEYLLDLRQSGVNRLSIGMQSSHNDELKFFARRHDHSAVVDAVNMARRAGFDNINLDLIYGIPNQTLDRWRATLQEAVKLDPEHLSLYALGIEPETPLHEWVNTGQVPTPDDDLTADMYDLATEILGSAGYAQYEISNWCKPGFECRHNIQYWLNQPYVGVGPGAHGYAGGVRYAVIRSPQKYVDELNKHSQSRFEFPLTPVVENWERLTVEQQISEAYITNLRLLDRGISREAFSKQFGVDPFEHHEVVFKRFEAYGIVTITEERILLTQKGRLLSNALFRELI